MPATDGKRKTFCTNFEFLRLAKEANDERVRAIDRVPIDGQNSAHANLNDRIQVDIAGLQVMLLPFRGISHGD